MLVGMMVSHVDDVMFVGEGKKYEAAVEKMRKRVEFDKEQVGDFRYCGNGSSKWRMVPFASARRRPPRRWPRFPSPSRGARTLRTLAPPPR